jgi:hypothetical protein
VARRKLTLSIEGELLEEVKGVAAASGRSLSSLVEEYLGYLVFERWAEELAEGLGLGGLKPTTDSDVARDRPRGLDAAEAVRELREGRVGRIVGVSPSILRESVDLMLKHHIYVAEVLQVASAKSLNSDRSVTGDGDLARVTEAKGVITVYFGEAWSRVVTCSPTVPPGAEACSSCFFTQSSTV